MSIPPGLFSFCFSQILSPCLAITPELKTNNDEKACIHFFDLLYLTITA